MKLFELFGKKSEVKSDCKKELLEKEIEELELAVKAGFKKIEVAKILENDNEVKWYKDTIEFCNQKIIKYKKQLEEI